VEKKTRKTDQNSSAGIVMKRDISQANAQKERRIKKRKKVKVLRTQHGKN
jgi:hypothetical protein